MNNGKFRKAWKFIEHWLVVAIFLFVTVGGTVMYFFGEDFGMVGMPSGGEDTPQCTDAGCPV